VTAASAGWPRSRAAHFYGLPLLASIVAIDLVLSRLVFPRFDRRQLQ
jgi:hypothetical protein